MKKTHLHSHHFVLVLSGVTDETPKLEDALFESGCSDALIHYRNGTTYLEFDRTADNLEEAIISAIQNVESANIGAKVSSVGPDHFVNMSDIAKRSHLTRQSIFLIIKGERSDGTFPQPVLKPDNKSVLWRWSTVIEWLYNHGKVKDENLIADAKIIENINSALELRDKKTFIKRRNLVKRIQTHHG